MAVTGENVFNIAINLMDEVSDTGVIVEEDVLYYKNKTPEILTILQAELLPSSITPVMISDLTQNLLLNDKLAIAVLPYGLAAHLLLAEDSNPSAASFFNARYEELKKKNAKAFTTITDVYNVLSGMV